MTKVAKEVADLEFQRFIDMNQILWERPNLTEDDLQSREEQKAYIVTAMMSGALVINENGEPIFTPQRSENAQPLTFHEPTGASMQAMDRKKKTEDVGKLFATMGDMTRTDAKTFSVMKMSDLKVCLAITTLFLA